MYSTAELGDNTRTGHNFLVRENTVIGDGCLIGTNVVVDNDCKIGTIAVFKLAHTYQPEQ